MSVTAMPKSDTAPSTEDSPDTGAAKAKAKAKGKTKGKAKANANEKAKGSGKKRQLIALVLLVVLGGGGLMMFRPKPPEAPKPGEVIALDPIQINLAADHYLRVGIAMQLTDKAHEADGSKALDATIDQFSGVSMADVSDPKKRRTLKKELENRLEELYHHEVMEVYFTEFVTQ